MTLFARQDVVDEVRDAPATRRAGTGCCQTGSSLACRSMKLRASREVNGRMCRVSRSRSASSQRSKLIGLCIDPGEEAGPDVSGRQRFGLWVDRIEPDHVVHDDLVAIARRARHAHRAGPENRGVDALQRDRLVQPMARGDDLDRLWRCGRAVGHHHEGHVVHAGARRRGVDDGEPPTVCVSRSGTCPSSVPR